MINITFKKATSRQPHKFRNLAAEAIKAQLYVNGWSLLYELEVYADIKEYRNGWVGGKDSIVIAYYGDVPVGICLINRHGEGEPLSMTFVRKRYRRHGIGSKMMKRALGKQTRFRYGKGTRSTIGFFKKFPGSIAVNRW